MNGQANLAPHSPGDPSNQTSIDSGLTFARLHAGLIGRMRLELGPGVRVVRRQGTKAVLTLFASAPFVSSALRRTSGFTVSKHRNPRVGFLSKPLAVAPLLLNV